MVDSNIINEEANLGLELCENGMLEEGIKHLKYAAEFNHKYAIVNLGHALKLLGNYEEAFKWTLLGADLGDLTAITNLAIMYKKGQGTPCNIPEAIKLYKRLIELGKIDEGYNGIVVSYLSTNDESQNDKEKAYQYALEGSRIIMENNPDPQIHDSCDTVYNLALMYYHGMYVEKNNTEAIKYFEYCSKCGEDEATLNLACIYIYDEGYKNIPFAIELLKKSIAQGSTDAYFLLGYLYEIGDSIEKNIEASKYYYSMSIRKGNGKLYYNASVERLNNLSPEICKRVLSGKYSKIID